MIEVASPIRLRTDRFYKNPSVPRYRGVIIAPSIDRHVYTKTTVSIGGRVFEIRDHVSEGVNTHRLGELLE
jgi:hypothetical protein